MMKKAMICQPINGINDEEVISTHNRAFRILKDAGYEVIHTLFTDGWYNKESMKERGINVPLCFLAKGLENMCLCQAVYFCKGWENARGCKIEHEVAKSYGLEIIYEEE